MKNKPKRAAGAKTLAEIDTTFSSAQRASIKRRMTQLEQEELTLADLRKACRITQVDLAKKLGVRQATVSQVENSTDLYPSTLRKHIEAMGGELALTAKFPNRPPVVVALKANERA